MRSLDRVKSCWRWSWVSRVLSVSTALTSGFCSTAAAAPARPHAVRHDGVRVALPPGLREAPELKSLPTITHAFSDGSAAPVQLIMFKTAAASGEVAPPPAAEVTQSYA